MAAPGPNPITNDPAVGFAMAELTDDIQPGDVNLSPEGGTAALEQIIPFDSKTQSLKGNLRRICGFASRMGVGLSRTLPKSHPYFPLMVATRITGLRGRGYRGKIQGESGKTSAYAYFVATVQFSTVQYQLKTDQQVNGKEWNRFVEKRSRPRLEYLSNDRAAYAFQPVYPPGAQPSQNVVKAGIARPVVSAILEWTWVMVPWSYCVNSQGFAANIMGAAGTVNDDVFPPDNGYPAGCLLLEEPHIEPTQSAFGDLYATVKLPFRYINYPAAPNLAASGLPAWQCQGHNLYAHPSDPTYWYRIGDTTTAAPGQPRFPASNYTKIFAAVTNP